MHMSVVDDIFTDTCYLMHNIIGLLWLSRLGRFGSAMTQESLTYAVVSSSPAHAVLLSCC